VAYVRKTKLGRWRCEVEKLGVRDSETFDSKAQAKDWGARRETEIVAAHSRDEHGLLRKTLGEVLDEYALRVSAAKDGADKEVLRIAALKRDYPWLTGKVMRDTTTADWARWRDDRLKVVTGSTVLRDINLFSAVYQKAMHELGPYCQVSPFTRLEKPAENPLRDQRWQWRTTKRVLRHLGYRHGVLPATKSQEVAYAILVALRTGMRAQEVLSLSDENTDFATRVATVNHKMQYATGAPRKVPMQKQAARLLSVLAGRGRFFSMTPSQLDGLWRKQRDKILLQGLRFHDTRAEAITRLSRRVDVLTLSAISGIKDLKLLNDRYYRERADQIAARL
jgi:integrase